MGAGGGKGGRWVERIIFVFVWTFPEQLVLNLVVVSASL